MAHAVDAESTKHDKTVESDDTEALEDAHTQGSEGYVVKDLRSFNVVFV
jgi:hypothetical protein